MDGPMAELVRLLLDSCTLRMSLGQGQAVNYIEV
jgi:hypothetical protein